ncbi:MAG: hypothetical protein IJD39_05550 [Clostridia bacterium]|nr:hypothetical protein [Clostridia bacterium]
MMNNPAPAPKNTREKKFDLWQLLKRLLRRITNRWGWKLTSLVLAIFLWGGLISQDTSLPRDKTIDQVRINVTNEAVLRQNGLIVVSGLENLPAVKLRVSVPQKNYSTVTAANYTVRLDLSQIKSAGTQKVPLVAAPVSASLYGTVTDVSLDEVTLVVEEYALRSRIPVQAEFVNEMADGFYAAPPVMNPSTVEISGPETLVNSVARCVVKYDLAKLPAQAGAVRTSLPFILQDYDGNEVDMAHISVTSQTVTLKDILAEQQVYPLVSVPVDTSALLTGQPAPGYQVTDVKVVPDHVWIAAQDLSPFLEEGIVIQPYTRLSVNDRTSSVSGTLSLRKPGTAAYISTYDLQISATIEPIESAAQHQAGE